MALIQPQQTIGEQKTSYKLQGHSEENPAAFLVFCFRALDSTRQKSDNNQCWSGDGSSQAYQDNLEPVALRRSEYIKVTHD